jgi:prevent-host-death family protein
MLYKTYNSYIGVMSTPSARPNVDVSFRPQTLAVEVPVSHARAHLPELLDEVRDGRTVYLTRYGRRLAALVPADVGEHLERSEDEYWSKRARDALGSEPAIPWKQVVAELEAVDNG